MSGKKAELAERLETYINEHEGSPEEVAAAKAAATGSEGAAAGAEEDDAIAEAEEDAVAEPEAAGEVQQPAVMEEQLVEQAASEQAAEEQQQGQRQQEAMDVDDAAPPQQQQQQAAVAAAPKQQQRRQGGSGGVNRPRKVGVPRPGRGGGALTLADISGDKLTQLAEATWSAAALTGGKAPTFDPELVEQIYGSELGGEVRCRCCCCHRRWLLRGRAAPTIVWHCHCGEQGTNARTRCLCCWCARISRLHACCSAATPPCLSLSPDSLTRLRAHGASSCWRSLST